jgi:hypothetical protein
MSSCMRRAHVILYLLEADIVSPSCRRGLQSAHAALKLPSATAGGSSAQELKAHLPTALAKSPPHSACTDRRYHLDAYPFF